jgi:hypothetical protein
MIPVFLEQITKSRKETSCSFFQEVFAKCLRDKHSKFDFSVHTNMTNTCFEFEKRYVQCLKITS